MSVVGMSTELEIYLLALGLVQVVGLMIQQDTVFLTISLFHQNSE